MATVKATTPIHVLFKHKQACCRHNCVHVCPCMFISEHSAHQSVCPYLRLLVRCLLKRRHWQGLREQVLLGIDLLRRGARAYQRPVMIISIKPVGLLNTDSVRGIDGLRWSRGVEEMEQVREVEEGKEGQRVI